MLFSAYSHSKKELFGLSIVSCGHIFAEEGRRISRPHGRDDWLIFYVANGSERMLLDKVTDMKSGSFIIFRPNEPQEHIHTAKKTSEFYYAHFTAPKDLVPFGLSSSKVYFGAPSVRVRELFEELIDELQRKQEGYEEHCIIKLLDILCTLSRQSTRDTSREQKDSARIFPAIQLINREYYADHSLDDYAALCHMSRFHFLRIFKEITGSTPLEYKSRIRMEHAMELLEDMSLSVGEVGAQVGFSSPSYFCDAFKNKLGISPLQYRRSLTDAPENDKEINFFDPIEKSI